MITETLLSIVFDLCEFVITLLPQGFTLPDWASYSVDMISKATYFFPIDVWGVVLGNIIFCNVALLSWSIIEWIIKRIPGVGH